MWIIGCDLHARQQSVAMLDPQTGAVVNLTLMHEGNEVREFYSQLPQPVLVGIEAIEPVQWFLGCVLSTEHVAGSVPPDGRRNRATDPRKWPSKRSSGRVSDGQP